MDGPASVITATMAPIASDTSVSVTPAMGPIAEITASGGASASAAAIAAGSRGSPKATRASATGAGSDPSRRNAVTS